ncbi:dienelactone hydrolase family protein [Candidatus Poribacteria bacterium]
MARHEDEFSFRQFLIRYAQNNPPSMIYKDGDFRSWQRAFFSKLDELRGDLPPRVPLQAEVVERVQEEDHVREHIYFYSLEGVRVSAYMLIPNDLEEGERRPGLLCLHGHTPDGKETIVGLSNYHQENPYRGYALDMVRAGFVTLTPDWWGWGERAEPDFNMSGRDKCNVKFMAAAMYGIPVLSLMICDGQAALDYFISRPEVDGDQVGCLGNSFGGRMTMYMTVFDDRIKACAPSGCANLFRERSSKLSSCGAQFFPGLLKYGDVGEIFSLIAPRPCLHIMGTQDGLLFEEDVAEIREKVQTAYDMLDASDNVEFFVHDGGHHLRGDIASEWFRKIFQI